MEEEKNLHRNLFVAVAKKDRLFSFENYLMQRLLLQFSEESLFHKTISLKEFNLFCNRWMRCSKEDAFRILKLLEYKGLVKITHCGLMVKR